MAAYHCLVTVLFSVSFFSSILDQTLSQIPTVCTDTESLSQLTCCPDNCGATSGRGECADIELPANYSLTSTNIRDNWPHYFTRGCKCYDNYAGYDCSRCKYGYYGQNCEHHQVIARKCAQDLSDAEWSEFIRVMKMTRRFPSKYSVVLHDYPPGTIDLVSTETNLFNFMVWIHHYASKDGQCPPYDSCTNVDYAHQGTGFPTWHRQHLLYFEWEIQQMLKTAHEPDYHTFRFHFWDWRREIQTEKGVNIFTEARLGETRPNAGNQPMVYGDLVSGIGWNTICWYGGSGNLIEPLGTVCNPHNDTGPLTRCPTVHGQDVCRLDNPNWPSMADYDEAMRRPVYDTPDYAKKTSDESFRSFMEGFYMPPISKEECAKDPLCGCGQDFYCGEGSLDPMSNLLHNAIHTITGMGDLEGTIPLNLTGVITSPDSSPNDPLFYFHHGMVDCILEEWLQSHPDAEYPDDPSQPKGHRRDAYIIPFFPVVRQNNFLVTGDNFGFSCKLSDPAASNDNVSPTSPSVSDYQSM